MKTILVTGGTGMIGRHVLEPLVNEGFNVYATCINEDTPNIRGVIWIKCNLLNATEDESKTLIKNIKPTHLMCLAWCTTGNYLKSTLNELFYYSTLSLIRIAVKNSCKRVIVAGTCFEYDFTKCGFRSKILENHPTVSNTLYSLYKLKLLEDAETICKKYNASFAYGRIFYAFGYPSEKYIVTMIRNALRSKDILICGKIFKYDYIYVKDIAKAFTKLANSNVKGIVNISSGKGIDLETLAKCIINLTNSSSKIIDDEKYVPIYNVIGDNFKLVNDVEFTPEYTLHSALIEMIEQIEKDLYV
jgi:nucleoside-diphosphate-sugar epimerase